MFIKGVVWGILHYMVTDKCFKHSTHESESALESDIELLMWATSYCAEFAENLFNSSDEVLTWHSPQNSAS